MPHSDHLVIIDVETTGTSLDRDEVTALALVPLDCTVPAFECYVRTPETLDKLTGVARDYFRSYAGEWTEKAVSPLEATKRLVDYLNENDLSPATLVGHNVGFDSSFLKKLVGNAGEDLTGWISHRTVDTHSLLHALYTLGVVGKDDLSSDGAFRRFGIDLPRSRRHTALGDAQATKELYMAILDTFRVLGSPRLREALTEE